MSIAVCAHCGGPVVTFATMCPHCGQRGTGRTSVTVGDLPLFGSRRSHTARIARRLGAMLIVGAGAATLLVLARMARPRSAHEADDKELQCAIIQETNESYPGELATCQAELSYLRARDRKR